MVEKEIIKGIQSDETDQVTEVDFEEIPEPSELERLAAKYGTDKLEHGYMPHYAKNIPKDVKNILEIGIHKGASLKMWREYFGDDANIEALDNFSFSDMISLEEARKIANRVYVGSQTDIEFMHTNIRPEFDFISEDGFHSMEGQQLCFRHVFVNNLRSGGLYVIEDIHTSLDEGWCLGIELKDRTLHALKEFSANKVWNSKYFPDYELEYWQEHIDKIEIIDDKIAFIWKK